MSPDRRRPSPRRPRALSPRPGPRVGAAAAVGAGEGNRGGVSFIIIITVLIRSWVAGANTGTSLSPSASAYGELRSG